MPRLTRGRVWIFGDDINTDLILPGAVFLAPVAEQARHCFSANRPGWVDQVTAGDLVVAGKNFAVGSARPIGPIFVQLKLGGIVAESFNGLGLRNCVNYGVNALPCPGVTAAFDEGDLAEVDWARGQIKNLSRRTTVNGMPLPQPLLDIVDSGGVLEVLKREGFL